MTSSPYPVGDLDDMDTPVHTPGAPPQQNPNPNPNHTPNPNPNPNPNLTLTLTLTRYALSGLCGVKGAAPPCSFLNPRASSCASSRTCASPRRSCRSRWAATPPAAKARAGRASRSGAAVSTSQLRLEAVRGLRNRASSWRSTGPRPVRVFGRDLSRSGVAFTPPLPFPF